MTTSEVIKISRQPLNVTWKSNLLMTALDISKAFVKVRYSAPLLQTSTPTMLLVHGLPLYPCIYTAVKGYNFICHVFGVH